MFATARQIDHDWRPPLLPKVSILIACYNAAPYLPTTLASIAAQSYENYEVIVVDDGSTDESASTIKRHLNGRHTLIQQANSGAARARNVAFQNCDGDFVIFLDADDFIGPSHLEALVARAIEGKGLIALSRWSRFRNQPGETVFPERPTEMDMPGIDWLEVDWEHAESMTQSGMLLLPRSLVEKFGGWDERLTLLDDFEFFARMLSNCSGIRFAPEARLYYRSGLSGNLSARRSRVAIESAYLSLQLGTEHLLKLRDTPRSRRVCANLMQNFDYTYYPRHADLRRAARLRARQLGGATLPPKGPPRFHLMRRLVGWRAARLLQRASENLGRHRHLQENERKAGA